MGKARRIDSERQIDPLELDDLKIERRLRNMCFLRRQQLLLAIQPTRIAAQRPVGADHPVARHQHRDRVRAIGRADCARRVRVADRAGNIGIAAGLAQGDLAKFAPDSLLECGAANCRATGLKLASAKRCDRIRCLEGSSSKASMEKGGT